MRDLALTALLIGINLALPRVALAQPAQEPEAGAQSGPRCVVDELKRPRSQAGQAKPRLYRYYVRGTNPAGGHRFFEITSTTWNLSDDALRQQITEHQRHLAQTQTPGASGGQANPPPSPSVNPTPPANSSTQELTTVFSPANAEDVLNGPNFRRLKLFHIANLNHCDFEDNRTPQSAQGGSGTSQNQPDQSGAAAGQTPPDESATGATR